MPPKMYAELASWFVTILLAAGLVAGACSDSSREPDPSSTNIPTQQSGSSSEIDTSEWPTFSSPLGFELRYPPDWTLDIVSESQMRIVDPAYKEALDDAIASGQGDVGLPPIPGASQFSVISDISPGFDVDQLIGSCGNDAIRTTLLGRAAIQCPGTGTLTDTLSSVGTSYWIEFPPGHTMLVGGSVISEGTPDLAIIDAMLGSFRFTSSP